MVATKWYVGGFVLSVALLAVSIALVCKIFPDVIDQQLEEGTRLEVGTEQYDRFVKLPFPLEFKAYLFEVKNAAAVETSKAMPDLREAGPYVYTENIQKRILGTDPVDDTITYEQALTFTFDVEKSGNLSEDDEITVLNMPLMSLYQEAENLFLAGVVDHCLDSLFLEPYNSLFIKAKVRDLLFEGIPFCQTPPAGNMCSFASALFCAVASTKKNVEARDNENGTLRFSYLNFKSKDSKKAPDGQYTVNRGIKDISVLGEITMWNGGKYTDFFGQTTPCSRVRGTDSTIFHPRIETDEILSSYSTDICRWVDLEYVEEETYKDIDGYKFTPNPKAFYSTQENPEDDCFCTKATRDVDGEPGCFLDGVVDVQTCFKVPVLLSFPHFLNADMKYVMGVKNLNPDPEKHGIKLLIEPNTGTPLQGLKRVQLNAVLRPIVGIKRLESMTRVVLPLIWIDEGVSLTDKYIDQLNDLYFSQVKIVDGVQWTLIGVSVVLTILLGFIVIKRKFFNTSSK